MSKKTFGTDTPAELFMGKTTQQTETQPEQTEHTRIDPAPAGYKVNPLYVEVKSRRVQLLLQPSLYDKVKRRADAERKSFNQIITELIEEME